MLFFSQVYERNVESANRSIDSLFVYADYMRSMRVAGVHPQVMVLMRIKYWFVVIDTIISVHLPQSHHRNLGSRLPNT